ncbi:MAG: hypothetical protein EOO61_13905 [Hymenobacter sp.]|nr:MAG: hypothetical protein EOO61_13905 [Hymenobacter sp.]
MIFIFMFFIVTKIVFLNTIVTHRGLVGAHNEVRESLHQIDNQLRRRQELSCILVETAKGFMLFEAQTLHRVTRAQMTVTPYCLAN